MYETPMRMHTGNRSGDGPGYRSVASEDPERMVSCIDILLLCVLLCKSAQCCIIGARGTSKCLHFAFRREPVQLTSDINDLFYYNIMGHDSWSSNRNKEVLTLVPIYDNPLTVQGSLTSNPRSFTLPSDKLDCFPWPCNGPANNQQHAA
ncbi:unnamed protein product [Penicillium nalgiovense]|nr:unnamed protein product [Penicillium nalgiovense]